MEAKNVLHVSAWDNQGGSARSAYRLHTGLREQGIVSRMLVGDRVTDDPDVRLIARGAGIRAADWAFRKFSNLTSLQYILFPSSLSFLRDPWVREADVVQLYNIHGNYFSFTVLPALTRRKAVVWRLSDMWPLTGHCGYSHDCERWKTGCGHCPYMDEYPAVRWDTTALMHRLKNAVYGRSRLTLVAPSRWMESLARQSPLLSRFPVHYIPNGIDTAAFAPEDKRAARARLGIPADRRVVIFHDPGPGGERKGRLFLREISERLAQGSAPLALVFGAGSEGWGLAADVRVMGLLTREALSGAFSAADLFVFPSTSENLPNVVLESMACGTPAVTFATGGIVDAVEHGVTGEVVPDKSAEAVAAAVEALLARPDRLAAMSAAARKRTEADFPADLELRRFRELYATLEKPA